MSKRIAIVEDEVAIRENYAAAFRREGYAVEMYEARQPAMDAFEARLPDLVIIDVNLKDEVEGGFVLCRDLRSRANELPIIFLTARDSEFDAVSGLRLGADDYLTKDISLPHLMARVAALFRRRAARSHSLYSLPHVASPFPCQRLKQRFAPYPGRFHGNALA